MLVAHRKGNDHPGVRSAIERAQQSAAHRFAHALQNIGRTVHPRHNQGRRRIGPHVSNRAYAALEHPRLEIESARVGVAVGTSQSRAQAPALSRVQICNLRGVAGLIPGEGNPRGNFGTRRVHLFNIEYETHAALGRLGHFGDDPR